MNTPVRNLLPMSSHDLMDMEPASIYVSVKSRWMAEQTEQIKNNIVNKIMNNIRNIGIEIDCNEMSSFQDDTSINFSVICHPQYIELLCGAIKEILIGIATVSEIQSLEGLRYYEFSTTNSPGEDTDCTLQQPENKGEEVTVQGGDATTDPR